MKQSFGIQATAAAFDTLSSRLYSNPILAVIRELSTNANDAHVEAGVEEPFVLHIPTEDEPYFRIRDYGNGIPEDLVYNIYTTFFMSTKTEDEEQTGYFGLGSKSPYSLISNYTVTSYCEGRKKTYEMAKTSGLPTVEKIEDVETKERSGLEIMFKYNPEHTSDYDRFMDEAVSFFKGTSFMPSINFPEIDWEKYAASRTFYMNDSIEFGSLGYGSSKISINVAGVKFDIQPSEVKGYTEEIKTISKKAGIKKINIMAGKSDVTLTPSRETLHFDEKTIEFVINKFKSVINDCFNKMKKNYDSLSYCEMINLINNQSWDSELNNLCTNKIFEILHNKALFCYHSGRGAHIDSVSVLKKSSDCWRGFDTYYLVDPLGIKTTVKQTVVDNFMSGKTFDSDGKITSTSFINVIKSIDKTNNFLVLFPKDHKSLESLKKAIEFCGDDVKVIKWTDFCETKKEASGEKRKIGFKTRATLLKSKGFSYKPFSGHDPDLEKDEIGLIVRESEAERYGTPSFDKYIRVLDFIEPNYKLAIRPCKETVFKKMKEQGYQTVQEYVLEIAKKHTDKFKNELKKVKIQSALYPIFGYGYSEIIYNALNDSKYDELAKASPDFATARSLYSKENVEISANKVWETLNPTDYNLPDYKINFVDNFPLLKHIGTIYYSNVRDIFDYMLMCSRTEEFKNKKAA